MYVSKPSACHRKSNIHAQTYKLKIAYFKKYKYGLCLSVYVSFSITKHRVFKHTRSNIHAYKPALVLENERRYRRLLIWYIKNNKCIDQNAMLLVVRVLKRSKTLCLWRFLRLGTAESSRTQGFEGFRNQNPSTGRGLLKNPPQGEGFWNIEHVCMYVGHVCMFVY